MKRFIVIALIISSIVSGGCMTLKQPSLKVEYYTLEYDPATLYPASDVDLYPLQAVLRVDPFRSAPVYNTNRIIYRERECQRASYFYHKWKASPADMVTFFLARDITGSGLFKAVTVAGSKIPHTHIMEGLVDEFLEWDAKNGWEAVLSVNVTLLDAEASDISKKVIFQQRFSARKECERKHPKALAQAMSLAMAQVSEEICMAVHKAFAEK